MATDGAGYPRRRARASNGPPGSVEVAFPNLRALKFGCLEAYLLVAADLQPIDLPFPRALSD